MDIRFLMFLKRLGLVEEAHPFLVFYWNNGATISVYDPDNIPVCLSIVCHKSLKPRLKDTVLLP